jgi:hypothetical protein
MAAGASRVANGGKNRDAGRLNSCTCNVDRYNEIRYINLVMVRRLAAVALLELLPVAHVVSQIFGAIRRRSVIESSGQ